MHAGCWCENLKEREAMEEQGVGGRIILKFMNNK
jgi:hypothetical protein